MDKLSNLRRWAKGYIPSALAVGTVALGSFGGGWLLGLSTSPSQATAAPPPARATQPAVPTAAAEPEYSSDYSRRVVARIYGNIDITREELGEYLIARFGAEKLELLVNKRIIEHACRQKGIDVSAAEVEAAIDQDCKDLYVDRKTFTDRVLKHYRKTMYEWKEDVVKPRLMLARYCRDRVQVTEEDIRQAFERNYGEKVKVRIILYPPSTDQRTMGKIYDQIRSSDEEFDRAARTQHISYLAMTGGDVKPVSRYSGSDVIEKAAFSLRPGELSPILATPEGILVMKCVHRIPPEKDVKLEDVRQKLIDEVREKKTTELIPIVFKELSKQADPVRYLVNNETMADIERVNREELADTHFSETLRKPSR